MTLAAHTAAGQAAGYLFQPERALFWLAKCPAGSVVGVETEDDVAVRLLDGSVIHEQQKHSVQPDHSPFGDRSKDLWNTLDIWLGACETGEIDLDRTHLWLTTNKVLPDCLVRRIGLSSRNLDNTCVADLRRAGINPPGALKRVFDHVLAASDQLLKRLLGRIQVADGSQPTSGIALRAEISSLLHLPQSIAWDGLLDQLAGWLYNQILAAWRGGKPALIPREAFDRQYHRLLTVHRHRPRQADPEHLVPVTAAEVQQHRNHVFVNQLLAVTLTEPEDEVMDAICDFVRCSKERFRLSNEGDLTDADLRAFEDNLKRRWKQSCRSHCDAKPLSRRAARDLGYKILMDAVGHREALGGIEQEPYVSVGTYHRLADNLAVWWNPHFGGIRVE